VGGLFFGYVYKVLKQYSMSFCVSLAAIGYIICYFSGSLIHVYIGILVAGLGIGSTVSNCFQKVSVLVPAAISAYIMSITVAVQGVGQFIEPYVFEFLLKHLGLTIGRQAYGLAGLFYVIMAIVVLIYAALVKTPQSVGSGSK
jgi:MFS family permease